MPSTLEVGGEEGNFKWEVIYSYIDGDGNPQRERILAHGGFETQAAAVADAQERCNKFIDALGSITQG